VTWIEKDPAHAVLFAQDPLAALKQALPDLPANLLTRDAQPVPALGRGLRTGLGPDSSPLPLSLV